MTRERDIEQLLDAWFADGPTRVSDRAFSESIERVHRQRQRPAWRLQPWRLPTMSTPLRVLIISGALLAVIGGTLLFLAGGPPVTRIEPSPVVTPSPSPSATTSVVESPSPSPSPPPTPAPTGPQPLGASAPTAGEWSVPEFDPPFTFALQRDWGLCRIGCDRSGNFYLFHSGAGGGRSTGIAFTRFSDVYEDLCARTGRKPAPFTTPKSFFQWLKSLPQFDLGKVETTKVDGLPAMRAEATVRSTSNCGANNTITLGVSKPGTPFSSSTGDRDRIYAIDVRGKLMTVWVVAQPADFADAAGELEALIASLQFP